MSATNLPDAARSAVVRRAAHIRALGAAMVIALLGQLVLGFANTLWLAVPETGSAWASAAPAALISAHMMVGVALVVLAVWIGRLAIRSRDRTWLAVTGVGVVGIVLGIAGGTIFMGDTTSDGASFLMAVGCTIALGAYALGLYPVTSAATD